MGAHLSMVEEGGDHRQRLGLWGDAPTELITDPGVLRPDPETRELTLTAVHAGITVEQVRDAGGWDLRISSEVGVTDPPTDEELVTLQELREAR